METTTHRNHNASLWRYLFYALIGLTAGVIDMALGAFLASGDNRWEYGVYHSAAGLVGAPLAMLAWATHRLRRGQIFASIALVIGLLSGMAMLFELTEEHASISVALVASPFAFATWFLVWTLWVSLAVTRLIVIRPRRIRQRLSSHQHR